MFTCPILFLKFCSHISHHYLHRSTTHIQFLHYDKSDNGQDSAPRISIPPSPQCFTSCVIVFMHITAILVNNSFIIHDFQLNNARDSFVNLFYLSLIYSDYPLILYFIGFPLVDLNSVGYNLVSCGSASGWHKILVPHYSLFMFIEVNVVCQIQEKWKMAIYLKSLHAQIYQVGGQGSPDPHCKNSIF